MEKKFVTRSVLKQISSLSTKFPVIGLVGPRQVGKTTLVREMIKNHINKRAVYLDLEKITDQYKLEDPELYLSERKDDCIVLDEIQNKPELFPLLRALIDEHRVPLRYVILGSASPVLLRQSSESLAGRIAYIELTPFNRIELSNIVSLKDHHLRGGFPEAVLSRTNEDCFSWLENFIISYIERDFPLLGFKAPPATIRKLWEMTAWINGNITNYQLLAKSMELSINTIKTYMGYLENAFLIRRLPPYHFNLKKRLVKSPKTYIRDTGILHKLLRMDNFEQLQSHPIIGSSWESFVIEQIYSLKGSNVDLYFYRTHNGAEVDLVFVQALKPVATLEIKYTSAPKVNKGHINCIEDLKTTTNYIVTPYSDDYPVRNDIRVCNLDTFLTKYLPGL